MYMGASLSFRILSPSDFFPSMGCGVGWKFCSGSPSQFESVFGLSDE